MKQSVPKLTQKKRIKNKPAKDDTTEVPRSSATSQHSEPAANILAGPNPKKSKGDLFVGGMP